MSLVKPDVRAKILPQAHEVLRSLATARQENINSIAATILNRALLGEGFSEMLAAQQMFNSGLIGNNRAGQGNRQ